MSASRSTQARIWSGGRPLHLSARLAPYILLAPATALLVVFVAGPSLVSFGVALFSWNPLTGEARYVGLENFERVLPSDELLTGVKNTLLYTALTVVPSLVIGLLVALGIHSLARGRALWRTVYFLPVAATLVAMAVVWRWLFYPETGPIDQILGPVVGDTGWLSSTTLALPALALVGNWQGIGFATIIFLAGLANVPQQLHEAARMDGAGAWSRFWHVTWPALGPSTLFALVVSTIVALRVFDQVVVMTDGGPGRSTETLAFLLWRRGVDFLDVGGAAVINVVLLIVVLPIAVLQVRGAGRQLERRVR